MLGEALAQTMDVEVVAPVELNQLIVRFGESDEATLATIEELQRRGRIFVGPARWRKRWVMRISVTNCSTGLDEVAAVHEEICAAWLAVRKEEPIRSLASD